MALLSLGHKFLLFGSPLPTSKLFKNKVPDKKPRCHGTEVFPFSVGRIPSQKGETHMNTFKALFTAAVLCLTASSSNAEDIILEAALRKCRLITRTFASRAMRYFINKDVRKLQQALVDKGFIKAGSTAFGEGNLAYRPFLITSGRSPAGANRHGHKQGNAPRPWRLCQ